LREGEGGVRKKKKKKKKGKKKEFSMSIYFQGRKSGGLCCVM
jgi:hypothetical protein